MRPALGVALAVLVVAGCSELTAPKDLTCPAATVPLCMRADSTLAVITPLTRDAATRNTSVLENQAAKTSLTTELNALGAAINSGNVTQAQRALDRARAALATARTQLNAHPGDAPDLAAIELALIQAERALQ